MASFGYSIFGFLVAIGILVTVHEYGHFWVARKMGVKVERFSVGFGKVLKRWKRKDDPTEYVISMLPLGGYVKMLDERVEPVADEEKHLAFNNQSLAARAAIVAAGPAANYIFAILLMWALAVWGQSDRPAVVGDVHAGSVAEAVGFQSGDQLVSINGRPVHAWGEQQLYIVHQAFKRQSIEFEVIPAGALSEANETRRVDFAALDQGSLDQTILTRGLGMWPQMPAAEISGVVGGKPADIAGLQKGDVIEAIGETSITNWRDLVEVISAKPNEDIALTVQRDGESMIVPLTTASAERDGKTVGQIGVYPGGYDFKYRLGLWDGLKYSADYAWRFSVVSLRSIGKMFSRDLGTENLSGPISIAQFAGVAAQRGLEDLLSFLVIISISLGLINLLPIPILDGGHLLYFLIEAIKGSPVSERVMVWGQQLGILALALLMSLALYNDIIRLFS